jgi:hypothetical protein
MRQRVTYYMTGSPTSSVKPAASAERDIAISRASEATVHSRRLVMDQGDRTADLPVLERAEPARARGRIGLD